MKKSILAGFAALLLSSSVVIAADAYDRKGGGLKEKAVEVEGTSVNWNGVYVGGGVGVGATTFGDEDGQGGITANGFEGGLRLGIDVARGDFLFGVFGEYNLSDEALEFGPYTLLEKDSEWNGGVRFGIISGRTLFYGLGTYGQKNYSSGSNDETFDAWGLGLGIEHQIAKNFSIGLEYKHDWVDIDDGSSSGIAVNDDKVMARAAYRINSATFGW